LILSGFRLINNYLCDVIIDNNYRGKCVGKKLVEFIINSNKLKGLRGIIATKDAHGLYEKYGFVKSENLFMFK